MISSSSTADLFNATVRDRSGAKIGSVGQVYVDPDDASPIWASVKTGLFGTHESFVPLHDAEWNPPELHLPYDREQVKDAPRVDVDATLTEDETHLLYDYYGMGTADTTAGDDLRTTAGDSVGGTGTTPGAATAGTTGILDADRQASGTTGRDGDIVVTRSEERLNTHVERVPQKRVRLQKFTVTEMRTVTVPVTHEEVRLVEVPVGEHAPGDAVVDDLPAAGETLAAERGSGRHRDDGAGADSGTPHDLILTEERVVVTTERVPVERVRLATDVVTEEQEVTETLRRERIEIDRESADGTPTTAPADGAV